MVHHQEQYTKEWVEEKKKDFPSEALWKQEYPGDPDEAFISSGTPYFDNLILEEMLKDSEKNWPLRQKGVILPDGNFN